MKRRQNETGTQSVSQRKTTAQVEEQVLLGNQAHSQMVAERTTRIASGRWPEIRQLLVPRQYDGRKISQHKGIVLPEANGNVTTYSYRLESTGPWC